MYFGCGNRYKGCKYLVMIFNSLINRSRWINIFENDSGDLYGIIKKVIYI